MFPFLKFHLWLCGWFSALVFLGGALVFPYGTPCNTTHSLSGKWFSRSAFFGFFAGLSCCVVQFATGVA